MIRLRVALAAVLAITLTAGTPSVSGQEWSRWRGPLQNGHSPDQSLPVSWSDANVVWKTQLPGAGQSSPVVWGERIFLTAALESGKTRVVLAVNRNTHEIEWQREVWTGEPEPAHNMNGWASASCATDGEVVIAFFGKGGLHAFDLTGKKLWSRDLGVFEGPWGTTACPVIWKDLVIQNCDADADAYLLAVDRRTGKDVWKVPRPNFRGWSTPVIVESGNQTELVVNGHTGAMAYDPQTGKSLWHVTCPRGRGTPTVTPNNGLVYVINGLGGGGAYVVRPGGSGDVTDSHRLWFSERRTRDLPSPIIVGDVMLVMSLRGAILSGYDITDGRELWKARVGGQISSSPVAFAGKAFFIAEDGTTVVVDPAASDPVIARNVLTPSSDNEIFRASISPTKGQLLIRSTTTLYCIEARP